MFNLRNILIGTGVALALLVVLNFPRKKEFVDAGSTPQPVATSPSAKALYEKAKTLKNDRQLIQAKEVYQKILNEYPDFEQIESIQAELEVLTMDLIFSNAQTPYSVIHDVQSGDTLGELAKKYGTTVELIKKNNNLNSNIIRIGQKLRIWTAQFNIFVDKSQNILMLKLGDEVVKVYNVSTGKNNNTPVGNFKVTSKLIDPVWFHRGVVVPPESPENVLGSRWLGFDMPGYGIHGTVEPETIGQQVTAGCVRMRNTDVEELYSIIPMGTQVSIID